MLDHWRVRSGTILALRGVPEARSLRLGRVLKASPDAAVIEAVQDGRPVVVKRMLGADAVARSGANADELLAQYPHMSDGRFRVPEPILALPERGIVVMEAVGGTRLHDVLKADPEQRGALLRRAGEWLARYTEHRRVEDAFGGGFWIKTRRQAIEALPAGADRDRIVALVEIMKWERSRIGPRPITRARSHGDFCALNLVVDGETLWGLDIQNNGWIALMKDLARFLVYLEITMPSDDPEGPSGLSAEDVEALCGAPYLIRKGEVGAMLPFFAAVELSGRLLTETAHPEVMENARALANRMLTRRSG